MIQPNELRLGNIIYEVFSDRKEIIVVESLDNESINSFYSAGEYYYLDGKTEPIPLTEEWLLKAGFKEDSHRTFKKEIIFVNFHSDRSIHVTIEQDAGDWGHGGTAFYPTEVQSVHELQNLFYALTKQELTFDEKNILPKDPIKRNNPQEILDSLKRLLGQNEEKLKNPNI